MSITAVFALDGYEDDCSSIPNCIANWAARYSRVSGAFYVYGYRAEGSIFYIGKGSGRRAWDTKGHTHPRFHHYVTTMLSQPYSVEMLREQLAEDDADELEQALISCFSKQLVNADGAQTPAPPYEAPAYRRHAETLFPAGRAAGRQGQWDAAGAMYRNFLVAVSDEEQQQDDRMLNELRTRAATELACRVDLDERMRQYQPSAPVVACEALSRLTACLCKMGNPEEARVQIELFSKRYPRASFAPYDSYMPGLAGTGTTAVTKREQATLKRVEKALELKRHQAPKATV